MKAFHNDPDIKAQCLAHVRSGHSMRALDFGIPHVLQALMGKIGAVGPAEFIEAIPVGADLSMVWPRFALWLLADPANGAIQFASYDRSRSAVHSVVSLYALWIAGEKPDVKKWKQACDDAWRARCTSAEAAAWASKYELTGVVINAVNATTAAAAAVKATLDESRKRQSEKLIELLKEAK